MNRTSMVAMIAGLALLLGGAAHADPPLTVTGPTDISLDPGEEVTLPYVAALDESAPVSVVDFRFKWHMPPGSEFVAGVATGPPSDKIAGAEADFMWGGVPSHIDVAPVVFHVSGTSTPVEQVGRNLEATIPSIAPGSNAMVTLVVKVW